MGPTEILLTINSLLLAAISILFVVIGFFLKDLHRQFKTLVERVNKLYNKLTEEATASKLHREQSQREFDDLKDRVSRLEQQQTTN
ncbi:MAG: hypothetical protein AAF998_09385 [Bacteroidota bacterium]